jgi:hypothetical protein
MTHDFKARRSWESPTRLHAFWLSDFVNIVPFRHLGFYWEPNYMFMAHEFIFLYIYIIMLYWNWREQLQSIEPNYILMAPEHKMLSK